MKLENRTSSLQELYAEESARIQKSFEDTGDGKAAIRDRTALIDSIVIELWNEVTSSGGPIDGFCVAAMGGYGRRGLFPYSDIDLLFLYAREGREEFLSSKAIAPLSQSLWDLHLRVSPTTRTLAECGKLYRNNIEFNISLLDCRYICGDEKLFERLRTRVLPGMVNRESDALMQELTGLARARHQKYGQTIFHLEPNIKDGPGGLRDYQVACWLAQIAEMKRSREWKDATSLLPLPLRADAVKAIDFLDAVRCFLHYRQGRDLNVLTYELQSEAAASGIGLQGGKAASPNDWMRVYFRQARAIDRLTVLFDEVPRARSFWKRWLDPRRSPLSTAEFKVVDGRISLRQADSVEDPRVMFRLFELVAQHDLRLSAETENAVEAALPRIRKWNSASPDLWEYFRKILVLPDAASSLRAMHRVGLLDLLFKEFKAIDSLVIRDYYHRYTVDEHSLVAIETLHGLAWRKGDLDRRYRDILTSLEHPELLYLALLFHDVGKGMPNESHVEGSLEAVSGVFERLHLDTFGRETVTFLIANHLRMSATLLRRDIFDPEAVHDFARAVGTIEHLKMLTLFTYADIKAVNPEALTFLESGDALAALRGHGKLSESLGGRPAHVPGGRRRQPTGAPGSHGRGRCRGGAIPEFPGRLPAPLPADALVDGSLRALPDVPAPGAFPGGNQHHQARPVLRAGPHHQGPPVSVYQGGGHDLFLGHEHLEGRCLRQPQRRRAGHAALLRPFPDARSQSDGNPAFEAAIAGGDLR